MSRVLHRRMSHRLRSWTHGDRLIQLMLRTRDDRLNCLIQTHAALGGHLPPAGRLDCVCVPPALR